MTNEQELRLAALNAAVATKTPNVAQDAERFLEFLKGGDEDEADRIINQIGAEAIDRHIAKEATEAAAAPAGKKGKGKA